MFSRCAIGLVWLETTNQRSECFVDVLLVWFGLKLNQSEARMFSRCGLNQLN
jgi:hypothetical protein